MRLLNIDSILSQHARATGRWSMLVTTWSSTALMLAQGHPDPFGELELAAPYLKGAIQVFIDGFAILDFEDEAECMRHFDLTVGDSGPTETNPYTGPAVVYALVCGPDGKIGAVNT